MVFFCYYLLLRALATLDKSKHQCLPYLYVYTKHEEKILKAYARLAIAAMQRTTMMIKAWQGNMHFLV